MPVCTYNRRNHTEEKETVLQQMGASYDWGNQNPSKKEWVNLSHHKEIGNPKKYRR